MGAEAILQAMGYFKQCAGGVCRWVKKVCSDGICKLVEATGLQPAWEGARSAWQVCSTAGCELAVQLSERLGGGIVNAGAIRNGMVRVCQGAVCSLVPVATAAALISSGRAKPWTPPQDLGAYSASLSGDARLAGQRLRRPRLGAPSSSLAAPGTPVLPAPARLPQGAAGSAGAGAAPTASGPYGLR